MSFLGCCTPCDQSRPRNRSPGQESLIDRSRPLVRHVSEPERRGDGPVRHVPTVDVHPLGHPRKGGGKGFPPFLRELQHVGQASRCTVRRCWFGRRRRACSSRSNAPLHRRDRSDGGAWSGGSSRRSRPGRWPRRRSPRRSSSGPNPRVGPSRAPSARDQDRADDQVGPLESTRRIVCRSE